jgi:hypothetical protein
MNERLSDEEALTHEISDQALELACCYNAAQFRRLLSALTASLGGREGAQAGFQNRYKEVWPCQIQNDVPIRVE